VPELTGTTVPPRASTNIDRDGGSDPTIPVCSTISSLGCIRGWNSTYRERHTYACPAEL